MFKIDRFVHFSNLWHNLLEITLDSVLSSNDLGFAKTKTSLILGKN